MEIIGFVQDLDGSIKELTVKDAKGKQSKFVPEAKKEEVVIEVKKEEKKTSKK